MQIPTYWNKHLTVDVWLKRCTDRHGGSCRCHLNYRNNVINIINYIFKENIIKIDERDSLKIMMTSPDKENLLVALSAIKQKHPILFT